MERLLATPKTIPVLPSSRPIRATSGTHDTAISASSYRASSAGFARATDPRGRFGRGAKPPSEVLTNRRPHASKTRERSEDLGRRLADVDVATDRDRRRRAAIDGAALAVVCGLAARLVERESGRSEPAIAESRGAIDGDLRAGADPDLDRLRRRRRDPRVPDGEAPGRRHDLAREEPADDRERFLERRRARRQARAHRGELALVVAEAALEDEASPRERRQRPHLLRHEDRIPERQEEEAAV